MEIDDLAQSYKEKSDDELLRLALDPSDLTDEARLALSAELHTRGIDNQSQMAAFRLEEERSKEEQSKQVGHLGIYHRFGLGRLRFCKSDYKLDRESGLEQFVTTVFVVLLWLPLIPIGTYRIQRRRAFFSTPITVLERLPLDWDQVLAVGVVTMGALLVVIWVFKLLPRILYR